MRIITLSFAISFFLLIFGLGYAYIKLADTGSLLIIHFDQYRGIDFFGSRQDVFTILFSGLAMIIVNLLLALAFYRRERFISTLISFFTIFLSALILISVFVIISVN